MRWKVKPYAGPLHYDKKVKRVFLLVPECFGSQWRWLEWVNRIYIYSADPRQGIGWRPIGWEDE